MTIVALAGWSAPSAPDDRPMIDADVRAAARGGMVRVLVELRASPTDPTAIGNVQDETLRRLAGTGARVARRYSTAPLLVLEIDAAALARLEEMRGLVTRVRTDQIVPSHGGSAPRR